MDDAALYAKSNGFQRVATKKVLAEFAPLLKWRKNGCDSVLDVGCGSGDVTIELILPVLPENFNRLIACDLSHKMIEYAQRYHRHPKVTFVEMDIRDRVDEFLRKFDPFDHIVSFFCLNWVKNQKEVLHNIRKLLTADGDCLLMFLTSAHSFAVYKEMSKSEKWSKYMKDADLYIPFHQYVTNPVEDFRSLCESVGFSSSHVETQEPRYICKNFEECKSKS